MAEEKKPAADDIMKEFARIGREYNYRKQGIFFLNAMWQEYQNQAEDIWNYVCAAGELDKHVGEKGHAMDEFEVCLILFHFILCPIKKCVHLTVIEHINAMNIQ